VRYDERRNFYAEVDVLRLDPSAVSDGKQDSDWTILTPTSFDERFAPFLQDASTQFWLVVERKPEYLNWRFADHGSGGFTIRTAEQGGLVLGYAVHCVRRGRGQIADLLALPGCDDVAAALLTDAVRALREAGASSIECWSTRSHPYRELLGRCGFSDKRRTMQFYCQPMRVPDEVVAPFERRDTVMHLMSGDTDLV
jgi:hypothetical protein